MTMFFLKRKHDRGVRKALRETQTICNCYRSMIGDQRADEIEAEVELERKELMLKIEAERVWK